MELTIEEIQKSIYKVQFYNNRTSDLNKETIILKYEKYE